MVAKEASSRSSPMGSGPKARVQPLTSSSEGSSTRKSLHFPNKDSIEVIAALISLIPCSQESSSLTTASLVRSAACWRGIKLSCALNISSPRACFSDQKSSIHRRPFDFSATTLFIPSSWPVCFKISTSLLFHRLLLLHSPEL